MADWSRLLEELLQSIAERLHFPFYLLRFRSVCSSWRSSVSVRHHPVPGKFPILSNEVAFGDWTFCLSKRTLFLVHPPTSLSTCNSDPWLLKIQQDVHGRIELCEPLSRHPIKPLPMDFPTVLNLYNLPIIELGQEYVLNNFNTRHFNPFGDIVNLYLEKVVFTWLNSRSEEFVLLTIHISGKLAFFKSGDKGWTIIRDMPTPYDDVCVYKGRHYAVDSTGRAVVVGFDSSVSMVAESVFGGDKKFLVESNGELLLVDKFLYSDNHCLGINDGFDDEICFECEKAVRFDVYKLDEEGKKWIELKSLGDRVLFFGDHCAFSASSSDLSVSKGNCIIFRDDFFNHGMKENGVAVFHLDDDRIIPLSDCPVYSKLFWPPPDWVRMMRLRDHFEELTMRRSSS